MKLDIQRIMKFSEPIYILVFHEYNKVSNMICKVVFSSMPDSVPANHMASTAVNFSLSPINGISKLKIKCSNRVASNRLYLHYQA